MRNETLEQEDKRKPIFIAKYPNGDSPWQNDYLFIYRTEDSNKKGYYSQCRAKDAKIGCNRLNTIFPEGVKFGLASKILFKSFVDNYKIEQLSMEEFFEFRDKLEDNRKN